MWPFIGVFVGCNTFIRLYHGDVAYPGAALGAVEELRRIFFSSALVYLLLFAYLALSHRAELLIMPSWNMRGRISSALMDSARALARSSPL